MLEITNRALEPDELESLMAEIERLANKKKFHYRFTIVSLVFLVIASGLLLFFFAGKESVNLLLIAFVLIVIYALSVIWGYKQNSKMFNENIREIEDAIGYNNAEVYKCFSEKCISFQNKSLDKPAQIFEISENQLLFLTGFEFYSNDHFPNSDFEVIAIKRKDGTTLQHELRNKGIVLKPLLILSDLLKKKLRDEKKYPKNLTIISGKLEEIEKIFV